MELDLATYNVSIIAYVSSFEALFKELFGVDIIGLSEVRKTGEDLKKLKNGHIFCHRGQKHKKQHRVDSIVIKEIDGNIKKINNL